MGNCSLQSKLTKEEKEKTYFKKLLYYELKIKKREYCDKFVIKAIYITKEKNVYSKFEETLDTFNNNSIHNIITTYDKYNLYGGHPLIKFKNSSVCQWTLEDQTKYKLFDRIDLGNGDFEYVPLYYGNSTPPPSAPPKYEHLTH